LQAFALSVVVLGFAKEPYRNIANEPYKNIVFLLQKRITFAGSLLIIAKPISVAALGKDE